MLSAFLIRGPGRSALALLLAGTALHAAAQPAPRFARAGVDSSAKASMRALRHLVHVEGVRENQLIGYGLVVGLNGSGVSTQVKFAGQSVNNMLTQFGVKLPEKSSTKLKNVATVMVSAVFPPGYRKGQTIDVTVSSLGDAKNLRGGMLLMAPLRGDGTAPGLSPILAGAAILCLSFLGFDSVSTLSEEARVRLAPAAPA